MEKGREERQVSCHHAHTGEAGLPGKPANKFSTFIGENLKPIPPFVWLTVLTRLA